MKKIYLFFTTILSTLVFPQIILNQSETGSRTVSDPQAVILAQGFSAKWDVSNPFVAKIGASSDNPSNPTNSDAGSTNPSGSAGDTTIKFHDTQGNIDVNGGGQLQYTLPIALPPGVKSVAPQINLIYTSGSGNGIAGYGWNISGITAISRVGRTIEKDGEVRGIKLDYSDYYSFNGQRLILKSGEYGKDGAEYVTEKYSNVKIKSVGSINGQQWQGPEYWEVTFEDGSQAWYGAVSAGVTSPARTPVEYNIVKWKDAQGNYISYNYAQTSNVATISSIQWGGNEILGMSHFNEIVFTYAPRSAKETSYSNGILFEQTKLLANIQVKANGNQFKRYQVEYEDPSTINGNNSDVINYKFVKSIKEYGSSDTLESNPVNFTTSALTTKTEERPFVDFENVIASGDYNGDGLIDFIVRQNAQNGKPEGYYLYFDAINNGTNNFVYLGATSTYFPSLNIYTYNIKPADNIVKPKQGLLIVKNNTEYSPPSTGNIELKYYSVKSDASVLNTTNNPLVLEYSKIIQNTAYEYNESIYPPQSEPSYDYINTAKRSSLQTTKEIDIDSDGLSETIMSIQDSKCYQRVIVPDPIKTIWTCNNLGYRHIVIDNFDISNGSFHTTPPLDKDILSKASIMDFDNDGVQDIIFIKENGTTNVTFYTKNKYSDAVVSQTVNTPLSNLYQYSIKKNGNNYLINLKNTFSIKGLKDAIQFGDLNGDKNIEVLAPLNKNQSWGDGKISGWSIYLNTGAGLSEFCQGFTEYYKIDNNSNVVAEYSYPGMIDLDNDGKSEFIDFYAGYNIQGYNYSNLIISKISEFRYDPNNIQFKWSYKTKSLFSDLKGGNSIYPIYGDFRVNGANSKILFISKSLTDSNYKKIISFQNYNLGVDKNIKSITQGGLTTTVDYKELDPAINPGLYAPVKTEQYPYMELDKVSQSYVVSQLAQDNRKQDFKYRGFLTHLQGKGMIGFRQTARSSWYANGFENTVVWSGAEIDPLNESVPIKEWSVKTYNDNNLIFPSDISENNNQLLSYKKTEYYTVVLSTGIKAIVPWKTKTKDFLKDTTTDSEITYGNYYLPVQTNTTINGGFATSQAVMSYINNPAGIGKDYYIGRPSSKVETNTAYQTSDKTANFYTYNNSLLQNVTTIVGSDFDNNMSEEYFYDGFGNITQKTITSNDGQTQTIQSAYDPKGRFVTKKTDNLGLQTNITYNDWGQVLTQTDPLGIVLTNTYDGWGKLLTSKTNLDGQTTYTYAKDSNGRSIVTQYDPDGNISKKYTDKLGREYKTQTKAFGQNNYIAKYKLYDEIGRTKQESEPYFDTTGGTESPTSGVKWNYITYDDNYFPAKATATSFNGKQMETLVSGRTTTVKELNGNLRTMTKTTDALGNVIVSTDKGGTINFSYNAAGKQIKALYDTNAVTTKYDDWGRKIEFNDPSNGTYKYQYDGFGNILKETSPKGYKQYTYNSLGQLINQKELSNDNTSTNKSITYSYNPKGLIISKTGTANGKAYSSTISYDDYGRVISSSENSNAKYFMKKGIIYDDKMRVTSYEKSLYSSGVYTKVVIENVYDSWSGELYQVKDKTQNKILWELQRTNANGQVTDAKLGGTTIYNIYDNNNFLANVTHKRISDNKTILQLNYSFNAIKNELKSRTRGGDFNITENFEYDDNNRLVNWTDPVTGAFTQNATRNTYDVKGRITQNDQVGTFKFGNAQKLYQATGMVLNDAGHDNFDGKLLQKITYNENNDPIFIDGMKGDVAFEYGLTDMRQVAYYGGNFQQPTTGNQQPISKYTKYYSEDGSYEIIRNNQTGQEKHILYIGGSPYESNIIYLKNYTQSAGGTYHFLHKDYLGSILAITEETGYAIEQRHYDAWGNFTNLKIAGATVDPNNVGNYEFLLDRGYTGHEHFSEVGLIHMNGRLYDPLLRRFLNADENIQDMFNTQNYNKYGYVLNNPLMYNDPSGEFLFIPFLVGALLAVTQAVMVSSIIYLASAVMFGNASNAGFLKSITFAAISAGLTYGVGEIFRAGGKIAQTLKETGTMFAKMGTHALVQGTLSMMQGGNFWSGALSAAFSSLSNDMLGNAITNSREFSVLRSKGFTLLTGAISGGVGSVLGGGNFWQGVETGLIITAFNFLAHQINDPTKKNYKINGKTYDHEGLKEFYAIVIGESSNNIQEAQGIGEVILNRIDAQGANLTSGFVDKIGGAGQYDAIGQKYYNEIMNMELMDIIGMKADNVYYSRSLGASAALSNWWHLKPGITNGAFFWNATWQRNEKNIGFNWRAYNRGAFVISAQFGQTTFFKYSNPSKTWP